MIKKQVESTILRKLEAIELSDTLAVAKLEVITTLNSVATKEQKEGVADISELNKWNGGTEGIFNQYSLVDKVVVEKYRKYGMPSNVFASVGWDYDDLEKATSKTPYTDFKNGKVEDKQFVLISGYDHSMHLMDGTVVSKPMHFSYIEAQIDNTNYDLEKLAELLYKRDDIIFYNDRELMHSPLSEEDCKNIIQDIPYYNAEGGRTETIEFFFALPQEQFDQMRKDLGKKDSTHERFDYIKKHDLLGIEAASLNRDVEPVPEKKKNKFR